MFFIKFKNLKWLHFTKSFIAIACAIFTNCNTKGEVNNLKLEELGGLKKEVEQHIMQYHDKIEKEINKFEITDNCYICYEYPKMIVKLKCNHVFCYRCINDHENKKDIQNFDKALGGNATNAVKCPYCNQNFTEFDYNKLENVKEKLSPVFYVFRTLRILLEKNTEFWNKVDPAEILQYLKYTIYSPINPENFFNVFIHEDDEEEWQVYEAKSQDFVKKVIMDFSPFK